MVFIPADARGSFLRRQHWGSAEGRGQPEGQWGSVSTLLAALGEPARAAGKFHLAFCPRFPTSYNFSSQTPEDGLSKGFGGVRKWVVGSVAWMGGVGWAWRGVGVVGVGGVGWACWAWRGERRGHTVWP